MSMQTWKQEFYPEEAYDVMNNGGDDLALVEHSLQKWLGLLPENLEKHGLQKLAQRWGTIAEVDNMVVRFCVDSNSCALCQGYVEKNNHCEGCPLFKHVGERCGDSNTDPFSIWYDTGDPKPMIQALTEVRDALKAGNRGQVPRLFRHFGRCSALHQVPATPTPLVGNGHWARSRAMGAVPNAGRTPCEGAV